MVRLKEKSIDYYIERLQGHLLKKFPDLEFETVKWSDTEATIYYRPYSEEEEWPIIRRSGGITTDALVDSGFKIHITPR